MRIMKQLSGILLVTLVSAALMQLYRAHMEQQYTCEVLAREVKCKADLLNATILKFHERTRRDTQKIAELETKLTALTAGKSRIN
jgi:hypothetical protein